MVELTDFNLDLDDVEIPESIINTMMAVNDDYDKLHDVYLRDKHLSFIIKGEPWCEKIFLKDGNEEHFIHLNNKMLYEYLHELPSKNYEIEYEGVE